MLEYENCKSGFLNVGLSIEGLNPTRAHLFGWILMVPRQYWVFHCCVVSNVNSLILLSSSCYVFITIIPFWFSFRKWLLEFNTRSLDSSGGRAFPPIHSDSRLIENWTRARKQVRERANEWVSIAERASEAGTVEYFWLTFKVSWINVS